MYKCMYVICICHTSTIGMLVSFLKKERSVIFLVDVSGMVTISAGCAAP